MGNLRDRRLAWAGWVFSVVLLIGIYHNGLFTWFTADDFAWLSLYGRIHSFSDLLREMFTPQAQGTIRPLSDRGFFLLFESIFGLESFPMRVCGFITMAANTALVSWLARRVAATSLSQPAASLVGILAPALWIANAALVTIMYWNSAYNEPLCMLCLLAALWLFVRYADSGERKWWWWQLAVFVLGFGVLETNVVYPALAAAWVLFVEDRKRRRELLVSLTPLAAMSIAYFVLHRSFAPLPTSGPYETKLDLRVFHTAGLYLLWTVVPQVARLRGYSRGLVRADVVLTGLALAVFAIDAIRKRRRAALFCAAWFLIPLAPMLLLPNHATDYYLAIPLIGAATFAAWGAAQAVSSRGDSRWAARGIMAAAIGIYLFPMVPSALSEMRYWRQRGDTVRVVVLGVASAHGTHPDRYIVLDGMNQQLWNDALADDFYYSIGMRYIYLTPETRPEIHADDPDVLDKDVLEPAVMRRALNSDRVVIYSLNGNHLRNVTEAYRRSAPNRLPDSAPHRVEAGNPLYSWLLGPEWFPAEGNFRWMPQRASVLLGGPSSVKDRLILDGSRSEEQLRSGPVHLRVSVDEYSLPESEIGNPETSFHRLYDLPPGLAGRTTVTVRMEVDRVMNTGGRSLGLVFGTIAIRPGR